MTAALELREVACVRGGRTLFAGVSRRLAAGQLLRVQGANGAGKTSLLRMLCGLLAPTAGAVLWRGQTIAGQREEFNRSLLYLGHEAALKDDLSPLENLRAASTFAGCGIDRAQAARALGEAGLRGHENTQVRRLSHGQRRRAALARLALAPAAALWVLDEPFNALDGPAAAWLAGLIATQLKTGGMVVLTSHQDTPVAAAPDQVLAL